MNLQEELQAHKKSRRNPFVIQEGEFDALEDPAYRLDWAEETFLSGNSDKEMLRRTFDLSKLRYISVFILIFFFIIFCRIFWLQIIRGSYYYSLAEGNRLKVVTMEPKRGIIYDSQMRPLVKNEPNFILYLIPGDLPKNELDRDDVLRKVSSILDQGPAAENSVAGSLQVVSETPSFQDLKSKVDKINLNSFDAQQPLFVADNLEYNTAMALYLLGDLNPGVFVSDKISRLYVSASGDPAQAAALGDSSWAHILGYTGKISDKELTAEREKYSPLDYVGKTGLEYSYEDELRGQKGATNIEVDALGKEKKIVSQTLPVDGHSLVLSINYDLQKKAEEVTRHYLSGLGLRRASVVAMDPNNGEILALVSLPGYDNNLFEHGISQAQYNVYSNSSDHPLFNRAVSGEFPPGSVFKLVMAAAGLEEKVINENTTVNSTGGLKINQWFFPDWKAGGHGITNVKKALAESVNTFFYILGGGYQNFTGLGIERIVKYAKIFGLGSSLGIDLPGEGQGFLPTMQWKKDVKKETWYIGDTYHASIGQGDITVTPIQVAAYTAFFANGGKLYQPHVVKQILDQDNQAVKNIDPVIIRQNFISPQNIEIIREGLRQTVTAGSARSLGTLPVAVAGKTGTAQWSTVKANQAWFTGFAPYDKPEIVITVLMEEGGEGSSVSVPIARDILQYYFAQQKVSSEP